MPPHIGLLISPASLPASPTAFRCRWQSALLELPSDWQASFLVPSYSDYVAEPGSGNALMDQLPRWVPLLKRGHMPGCFGHVLPGGLGGLALPTMWLLPQTLCLSSMDQ